MKKAALFLNIIIFILGIFSGCDVPHQEIQVAATTLPVYEFTARLCAGTDIRIGRIVTESVSCLHDYTLQVRQMRMIEEADTVVISGAGLEEFIEDALNSSHSVIDASAGTHLHEAGHHHDHDHDDHHHEADPHIWLDPENARIMVQNISAGLSQIYPLHQSVFAANEATLLDDLNELQVYAQVQLSDLTCKELITFHDGFAYFAEAFDLTILQAVEEESGSEASASELIDLISSVNEYQLPAIFTEENGSTAAAEIIRAETGAGIYTLDMAMSGDSYFDAMYHNINTIKEALG